MVFVKCKIENFNAHNYCTSRLLLSFYIALYELSFPFYGFVTRHDHVNRPSMARYRVVLLIMTQQIFPVLMLSQDLTDCHLINKEGTEIGRNLLCNISINNCSSFKYILDKCLLTRGIILWDGNLNSELVRISQVLSDCGVTFFYERHETVLSKITNDFQSVFFINATTATTNTAVILFQEKNYEEEKYYELNRLDPYRPDPDFNSDKNILKIFGSRKRDGHKKRQTRQLEEEDDTFRVLENQTLMITTNPPYLPFINKTEVNGSVKYSGVLFEMLQQISNKFQFSYVIMEPSDHNFGMLINNSWNGLIGNLVQGEADIALSALTETYQRELVVDFSAPYYLETIGILFRHNEQQFKDWKMITPFKLSLWIGVGSVWLVSIILIKLMSNSAILDKKKEVHFGYYRSLFYTTRCLIRQKCEIWNLEWSTLAYYLCWSAFILIVNISYTGSLVAVLTTTYRQVPFKDYHGLKQAIDEGAFKVCIQNGTAFHNAILLNINNEYTTLNKFLTSNPTYANSEEYCVDAVLKNPNVAMMHELTRLREIQKINCENYTLFILDDGIFPGYFTLAFRKNSSLTSVFSSEILKFLELGFVDEWQEKYSQKVTCKVATPDDKFDHLAEPITLPAFIEPLFLYLLGVVIGGLCFIAEQFIHRRKNRVYLDNRPLSFLN